jgi:hypothetical protein
MGSPGTHPARASEAERAFHSSKHAPLILTDALSGVYLGLETWVRREMSPGQAHSKVKDVEVLATGWLLQLFLLMKRAGKHNLAVGRLLVYQSGL